MSKKMYTIFLLSLVFLSCAEKDIKMQDERYDLRGKVKQLNIYIYLSDTIGDDKKSKIISLFDKTGTLTQESFYSPDGTPDFNNVYTYSKSKHEGEFKEFKAGEVRSITIIKYDNKGYLLEYTLTNLKDSKKHRKVFKNNSAGRPIEITTEDGEKQVLEYDNKGDLIKSTSFVSGIITYQNEGYDKAGNWTKQRAFYNGSSKYVEERQIEYYE